MINANALGLALTLLRDGFKLLNCFLSADCISSRFSFNILDALFPLTSKATISTVLPVLGI